MTHDPMCGEVCTCSSVCEDVYCNCDLIARVREDERQSVVSFMRDWIDTDPVIQSYGPDDIWSYGHGVRFALTRIEALGGER